MEYFYDICADESLKGELLDSLRAQTDCLLAHFGLGKTDLREASCHWEGLNSSSVLEPVVRLYNMTGEEKYLNFADYIVSLGGIKSANIFELALRIPGWCRAAKVRVNGEGTSAGPGWLKLQRLWQDGDRVSLRFPMPVELLSSGEMGEGSEKLPPHKALVRGPIALAVSEEFPEYNLSAPVGFKTDAGGL